jgi:hypothetical protein
MSFHMYFTPLVTRIQRSAKGGMRVHNGGRVVGSARGRRLGALLELVFLASLYAGFALIVWRMLSGGLSILKEGTAMLLFSAVAATFFVVIYRPSLPWR